jgi:hypothetical protein
MGLLNARCTCRRNLRRPQKLKRKWTRKRKGRRKRRRKLAPPSKPPLVGRRSSSRLVQTVLIASTVPALSANRVNVLPIATLSANQQFTLEYISASPFASLYLANSLSCSQPLLLRSRHLLLIRRRRRRRALLGSRATPHLVLAVVRVVLAVMLVTAARVVRVLVALTGTLSKLPLLVENAAFWSTIESQPKHHTEFQRPRDRLRTVGAFASEVLVVHHALVERHVWPRLQLHAIDWSCLSARWRVHHLRRGFFSSDATHVVQRKFTNEPFLANVTIPIRTISTVYSQVEADVASCRGSTPGTAWHGTNRVYACRHTQRTTRTYV